MKGAKSLSREHRQRWRWRRTALVWAAALSLLLTPGNAQQDELSEYQLKAAFIYNFAKFVEWPADAFPEGGAPLRICVLGENPFGNELLQTVNGKKVNGHPLVVVPVLESHQARGCHVLFLSRAERKRIPQTLEALRNSSTLTVGESDDFMRAGGVINFVLEGGKVRFEVSLRASEQARLKISSKLLSLARTVWAFPEGKG